MKDLIYHNLIIHCTCLEKSFRRAAGRQASLSSMDMNLTLVCRILAEGRSFSWNLILRPMIRPVRALTDSYLMSWPKVFASHRCGLYDAYFGQVNILQSASSADLRTEWGDKRDWKIFSTRRRYCFWKAVPMHMQPQVSRKEISVYPVKPVSWCYRTPFWKEKYRLFSTHAGSTYCLQPTGCQCADLFCGCGLYRRLFLWSDVARLFCRRYPGYCA